MSKEPEQAELVEPSQAVAVRPQMPIAVPSAGAMLQALIEKGVTKENVDALKELTTLMRSEQDRQSKCGFVSALKAFQSEAKKIQATRNVPAKDGTLKFRFADFNDIMDAVQPMADQHGFVISFSSRVEDGGRITKICKLTHSSGHSIENEYTVRIGSGPPGSTETQSDGAAHSYAKRGALCDALNIRIDRAAQGAQNIGGKINREQADSLRQRVRASGLDEAQFMKFAGVEKYMDIADSRYAELDAYLRKKEKTT